MSVKFIAFDLPIFDQQTGELKANKIKAVTEQEAINMQKENFQYNNDQDALQDFIDINWAWYVDLG